MRTTIPFVAMAACVVVLWGRAPIAVEVAERDPAPPLALASAADGVHFERNDGQTDDRVRFLYRGGGGLLFLTQEGSRARLGDRIIDMRLEGAREDAPVAGEGRLASTSNYFIGNDPAKWRSHVPHYAAVRYDDVYPGIDLVFHGRSGEPQYDFEVEPGADADAITLSFEGADAVELDARGDLVLAAGDRELRHARPTVYQDTPEGRVEIDGRFELEASGTVRFRLAPHDRALALVIDPVVSFTTYLGGSGSDDAVGIGVDASGAVYVAGTTLSADYPTQSPLQGTLDGPRDLFVSKLSADGSSLVYSTFLGGSGLDFARDLEVTAGGDAIVAGESRSTDYPTLSAFQGTLGGDLDVVVTRIASGGASLVYSTYLGGNSQELCGAIALDAAGAVHVVGSSSSPDFPTQSPIRGTPQGTDAFVTKFTPDGSGLVYSTYLGGSSGDDAFAIALDGQGAAFVTGRTLSSDYPVTSGVFDATFGGAQDAFVTKFDAAGSALVYSTFLGGPNGADGGAIGVDGSGGAVVTGCTGDGFPLVNPVQGTFGGNGDAFVCKLTPDASALVFSTFLGAATADEVGRGVAVAADGTIWVAGHCADEEFPTADAVPAGNYGWVVQFDAPGTSILSTTLVAGSGENELRDMAMGPTGVPYVAGRTSSTDTLGSGFQTGNGGGTSDAWYASLGAPAGPAAIGEGTLYAARAAFKVNWAQHGRGNAKDSLLIKGCLNPIGAFADPTGATVSLSMGGVDVPATTLDAKGRGKSDKGVTPVVRVRFKPSNGQYLIRVKNADLMALGVPNATGNTTEPLSVSVTVAGAGLLTDTVAGDIDFATRGKQDKSSRGAYSFTKGVSRTDVFKAARTQAREDREGGHSISLRGPVTLDGGGAITPNGDVTITVGDATPIVVPLASLRTTGSGAATKHRYARTLGEVAGLKKLVLDNRRRSITFATDALAGTGIPPSGDGESTAHSLGLTIAIETSAGTLTFGGTIGLLRPRATTGTWKR